MDIDDAKRRSAGGQSRLMASRLVSLIVTLLSTIIVARLVAPAEYGLAAMAQVVLVFAQIFRDFGVTNAILRKGTISESEINLVFWFNVVATFGLSVLLLACSPLAAVFFGEPIVAWILAVSVIGFLAGGIALQHRAILLRGLSFGAVAIVDIAGLVSGFVVTLVLALIRHDVWAIVIGTAVQSVVTAALTVAKSGWRPTKPERSPELPELIKFGANSTMSSLSVMISNNYATIVIGRMFDSVGLGFYNRAQNLYAIPNVNLIQPITQATLPLLTFLRPQPEEYRKAYQSLVSRLSVLLIPIAVTLTLAAVPLVELLLGDRWHTAGVILMALAPTFAVMGVGYAVSDLFITQDRSREMRNLGLIELVVRIGFITVGSLIGLVETALAFTISTGIAVVIRVYVSGRRGPVTVRDQVTASLVGIPSGLGSAIVTVPLFLLLPDDTVLRVAVIVAAGVVGALVGALLTQPSRIALEELAVAFGLRTLLRKFKGGR